MDRTCVLPCGCFLTLLLAKAIEINPQYAKAYYRRGLSYLAILRPTDAVLSFKSALKLDPNNASIRSQLDATVKLVRRIEFEKVSSSLSNVQCFGVGLS